MNINVIYSVTALGILLSLCSMLFIFPGKSIAGTDNRPQTIRYGNLELKTNSVLGVLTASLVTAVLPLVLQFILVRGGDNPLPFGSVTAEMTCNALKGKYKLYTKYDFIKVADIKATVRNGTWDAATCEKGTEEGSFVLKGFDTSTHEIEIIINNRFEHVATQVTNYSSEVFIDRQGNLIRRTLHYPDQLPRVGPTQISLGERGLIDKEDYIKKKLDHYVKIRDRTHAGLKTKICIPAIAQNNGLTLLSFLCHDYTRAMIKHH